MRRAAKRDGNEAQLITMAEQLGALLEVSGPLDLWCCFRGQWTPVEIKNPEGKNRYTDAQVLFRARCKERNAPVWTWRTIEDVVKSLGGRIAA